MRSEQPYLLINDFSNGHFSEYEIEMSIQAYAATLQAGPNQQHQIVLYNPQMCVPTSMMYVPQQGAGTQQAAIQVKFSTNV